MTAPSHGYRLLARATVAFTFLLIVLGGIVRVSDSGLGCGKAHSGVHGWPLCRGDVVPGVSLHAVIEYCHRITAGVVVVLMASLAVLAWRRYRGYRSIVIAATAASVLVIAQALLGAATVDQNLNEGLVTAHLGLAMLLFAITIYIVRASSPGVAGGAPVDGGPGFRVLTVVSQAILFVAIEAGGYMAGTEHFGRTGSTGLGAHEACGKEFPGCAHAGLLPFGDTRLVNIQLAHRLAVYLTVLAVGAVIVMILRRKPSPQMRQLALALAGLLAIQFALGVLNVVLGHYEALIAAHLTVASILWGTMTWVTIQLFRVPAPVMGAAPQASRAGEAVTT
ncbi:MAG: COX15/CtaA family protein [Thermoleophilaceae bacterium]